MRTGANLFGPLDGHSSPVLSVTVSPDDRWIASGSVKGDVRLWDMHTDAAADEPLQGHLGPVFSVAVSADCEHMASRVWDIEVRVWSMTTRKCAQVVKRGDQLYHSSVNALTATGLLPAPASSTLLSMSHTERSRYVYRGDPVHENIIAVFDWNVWPNRWHFDSERQRLWVVFEDTTPATADFK